MTSQIYRRWIKVVLGMTLFSIVAMPLVNWLVDPYDVIQSKVLKKNGYTSNERYLKVEKLLNGGNNYNAYIVGSSVMGVYDPFYANKLSESQFYNFSFLGGSPGEILRNLKLIKSRGKPINEIVFGIDLFWFTGNKELDPIWRKNHYLVTDESKYKWFYNYLLGFNIKDLYFKIYNNIGKTKVYFDIDKTGMYFVYTRDEMIAKNESAYINRYISYPNKDKSHFKLNNDALDELNDLLTWVNRNNIKCNCFINPMNQHGLTIFHGEDVKALREKIMKLDKNIVDFNESNEVVNEDEFFYDRKHYKESVAQLIMNKMLNGV